LEAREGVFFGFYRASSSPLGKGKGIGAVWGERGKDDWDLRVKKKGKPRRMP